MFSISLCRFLRAKVLSHCACMCWLSDIQTYFVYIAQDAFSDDRCCGDANI